MKRYIIYCSHAIASMRCTPPYGPGAAAGGLTKGTAAEALAVAPTVTLTDAGAGAPASADSSKNVVSWFTMTLRVPLAGTGPTPGWIDNDLSPLVCHVSMTVPPRRTRVRFALKSTMGADFNCGAGAWPENANHASGSPMSSRATSRNVRTGCLFDFCGLHGSGTDRNLTDAGGIDVLTGRCMAGRAFRGDSTSAGVGGGGAGVVTNRSAIRNSSSRPAAAAWLSATSQSRPGELKSSMPDAVVWLRSSQRA